jgi:hypothetical protein
MPLRDMTLDEIMNWVGGQPAGRVINIGPDGNPLPNGTSQTGVQVFLPGGQQPGSPQANNTWLYIIIGAVVLLAIMPKGK